MPSFTARGVQRSFSQSHAHGHSPHLQQQLGGAQVVRTPQDAMSSMGRINGNGAMPSYAQPSCQPSMRERDGYQPQQQQQQQAASQPGSRRPSISQPMPLANAHVAASPRTDKRYVLTDPGAGARPTVAGRVDVDAANNNHHEDRPRLTQPSPTFNAAPLAPPAFNALLLAHTSRPNTNADSTVLVTLKFSYSLNPEPVTQAVTVTFETLKPAGGLLIRFLENAIRPNSVGSLAGSGGSGSGVLDMTDGSSADESDFEFDEGMAEVLIENDIGETSPLRIGSLQRSKSVSSVTAPSPTTPSRVRSGYPPTAYPYSLPPIAQQPAMSLLPPLSAIPAVLAHARRPRSMTCPGPAVGMITELTVLLQRDAGAWHAIASRLCSGSWPSLEGKRRRVEDECRWAGMDPLLAELASIPSIAGPRGGYI
ncbi:uncharacterized protein LOC62_06G008401 [Vanrija pseudolonga]|uniref:Uncharacterized protein n=1 Tax=Vanrija pseudolonga TaxID=143232 RepID=A0AAF0YDP5_9TREE|nr:hypothetical protein LOC62_06G008401 [Vanrija pseudolonga]